MKKLYLFTLLILLPMFANADDSGVCGDGVTYYFESATGTLTISKSGDGDGRMVDTFSNLWHYNYNEEIFTVIINEGVTYIGMWAFQECRNLSSVIIPNSVTTIGASAFKGCTSLSSIGDYI